MHSPNDTCETETETEAETETETERQTDRQTDRFLMRRSIELWKKRDVRHCHQRKESSSTEGIMNQRKESCSPPPSTQGIIHLPSTQGIIQLPSTQGIIRARHLSSSSCYSHVCHGAKGMGACLSGRDPGYRCSHRA